MLQFIETNKLNFFFKNQTFHRTCTRSAHRQTCCPMLMSRIFVHGLMKRKSIRITRLTETHTNENNCFARAKVKISTLSKEAYLPTGVPDARCVRNWTERGNFLLSWCPHDTITNTFLSTCYASCGLFKAMGPRMRSEAINMKRSPVESRVASYYYRLST